MQRRLFKRRASGATEDGASHNGSASQHRRLAPIHEELDEDELDEWENAKRINLVMRARIKPAMVAEYWLGNSLAIFKDSHPALTQVRIPLGAEILPANKFIQIICYSPYSAMDCSMGLPEK